MYKYRIFLLLLAVWISFQSSADAQGVQQKQDDYYLRVLQLSEITSDAATYHLRPFIGFPNVKSVREEHPLQHRFKLEEDPLFESRGGLKFSPYEPVWFQSYNTTLPRGGHDGAIWQGKGYNTALSAGFKVEYGPLLVDFRPMIGMAQNLSYDLGPYPPATRRSVGQIHEYAYRGRSVIVDHVQRYGDSAYSWADWGDSSVELRAGSFRLAYSNKRFWTGPGVNTSLQFGYNAPGFRHLYLGTHRPWETVIGTLEMAYIFGKTKESDYYTEGRQIDSHSVNSLIVAWQPWFTDRFSIGGIRTYFFPYPDDFSGYWRQAKRLFDPGYRESLRDNGVPRGHDPDNQVANLFARYIIPEHGFEFYVEYGRNDHNANLRDFRGQPGHHRGYTMGLIKTMKLQRNQILALSIEFSELAATRTALTRGRGYLGGWYTHGNQILGLGNNGQLFGTEHGPGPNVQTVRVDWFKEKNSWTFTLARIGYHNSNFDQHFITSYLLQNGGDIERWEARNVELVGGVQGSFQLRRNIEMLASLTQSYNFNRHHIKENDVMNTRFEIVIRTNIEGWLR